AAGGVVAFSAPDSLGGHPADGGGAAPVARPLRVPLLRGEPMSDALLTSLRDLMQRDPGGRGLATVPGDNLLTACPGDFADACRSLAQTPHARLLIVTGFYI